MSDFSDAFADVFDAAAALFGDTCVIAGTTYACVIHGFEAREEVRGGNTAGRQQDANGTLYLRGTDWEAAKVLLLAAGRRTPKGAPVTVAGDTFRIINDPEIGYDSDTVELQLGPLSN
jgi:hypothetical protein